MWGMMECGGLRVWLSMGVGDDGVWGLWVWGVWVWG